MSDVRQRWVAVLRTWQVAPMVSASRMSTPRAPRARRIRNRLLASLPDDAYAELAPRLRTETFPSGTVLFEPYARATKVYFPETTVLSLIAEMTNGSATEVGTVGHEGFVGLGVLFGIPTHPTLCVVQVPGRACVLSARALRSAIGASDPLRAVILRYAHTYLHQVSQRTACNVIHNVSQRCARWLLTTDDTAGGTDRDGAPVTFELTQEYLAYMLGVRREGVSGVASRLRDAGLIRFSRGRMSVLDRVGLEAASCECYSVVATEYQRVLGSGS